MKTFYPTHEYTIIKAGPFKLVWQHHRPQDWLLLATRFLHITWETAAQKYRNMIQFGIVGRLRRDALSIELMFIWFYIDIEIGKIEPIDWMEDDD